jgi:hypothetical protein
MLIFGTAFCGPGKVAIFVSHRGHIVKFGRPGSGLRTNLDFNCGYTG